MRETQQLKLELVTLSKTLTSFIDTNRDQLSSKSVLLHDLKDIGFIKIGTGKWALDLKLHDISYVSFMLVFRGNSVDITEDHIIIENGKEIPLSKLRKPYTLTSVRYSRVVQELLDRVRDLTIIFRGGEKDP